MTRWLVALTLVATVGCGERKAVFDDASLGPCIGTPHDVPDGGWLREDGVMPVLEGRAIRGTDGLDALLDTLPRGFEVTRAEELAVSASCTIQRVVEARDGDGGSLFIEQRQLEATATLFNVPFSGRLSRDQHGSRGELVTDDFNGDGNRRTALLITDTGAWTLVVARGANSPDLAGWPTTTATAPDAETTAEPEPAPLSVQEAVELAVAISESTSTRPSR